MQQRKIRNTIFISENYKQVWWSPLLSEATVTFIAAIYVFIHCINCLKRFIWIKKRKQWWDLCLCIFVKQLEATCPHVVNQDWGRYSPKERLQNPQSKVARQELSLQKSREEQEQEQQANIFNPRERAERLIQIPPHYKLICKIRLHVATGSSYIIVKENN